MMVRMYPDVSKHRNLRRFKYIVHPLFKALYRYTRRKYKTRNSGFLDQIEKNNLRLFFTKSVLNPTRTRTQNKEKHNLGQGEVYNII